MNGKKSRADKNEEERATITQAIARLLDGHPTVSKSGTLSVSQLAVEAGVKRWVLTHKHTDLREQFEAKVREREREQPPHDPQPEQSLSPIEQRDRDNARLRHENAELRELVTFYAHVINELTIEYEALKERTKSRSSIIRLPIGTHASEDR